MHCPRQMHCPRWGRRFRPPDSEGQSAVANVRYESASSIVTDCTHALADHPYQGEAGEQEQDNVVPDRTGFFGHRAAATKTGEMPIYLHPNHPIAFLWNCHSPAHSSAISIAASTPSTI